MSYKFLIEENEIFAVDVNGLIIPKMKTLGTPYWDKLWNMQYIIDHNQKDYSRRFIITSHEYDKLFN